LGELILVLPDRERRRYIEYKLFDALVDKTSSKIINGGTREDAVREIVFRSRWIECLTGSDEKKN